MGDALGLSIGTTNLVAIRDGRQPVSRRSILTLFNDRAPEVGAPGEYSNSNQPGLVLTSFVERVGDPVAMVAPDGSSHRAEYVLVEALDAMARTVGGGAPITIAVPAHWGPAVVGALRAALRTKPGLNPNGVVPSIIPDAAAALSGLRAAPGLPPNGVVVLCDLGGTGTSITLADASAGLAIIGDTVRYPEFSGELIDQALLNHVVAGIAETGDGDPGSTAAVGSLTRLRDQCRLAKEQLSADTATVLAAELPGYASDFRVTRPELERLIDPPLGGLVDVVEDTLQRYRIPLSAISAVATVGGGAAIPLVTQRLSERLRAPVVTTPVPLLATAAGAFVVADHGLAADTPTGMAPAADAATGLAATMGWAADTPATQQAPAAGAPTSAASALAWSEDDADGEPVPYAGMDYDSTYSGATDARPAIGYAHDDEDDAPDGPPVAWYKRPPILFGAAAAALLLAAGGLAITLTGSSEPSEPVTETATSYTTDSNGNTVPVTSSSEAETVTFTDTNGVLTSSVQPPPPPLSTTTSTTTATTTPTTTTTTTTTVTTTTTTPPTTTRTTTATPPTTSSPPPSTSSVAPITPITPVTPNAAATPEATPEVTVPVLAPLAP
jgi:hypothetical protein